MTSWLENAYLGLEKTLAWTNTTMRARMTSGRSQNYVRHLPPEDRKQLSFLDLKPRERRLSSNSADRPASQLRSPLLTKLPLEIRRLIWNISLGGRTLHLYFQDRQLCCVQCRMPCPCTPPEFCDEICWPVARVDELPQLQLLSLLLSCRQM